MRTPDKQSKSISERIKRLGSKVKPIKQDREPLWKGPEVDGITQSMLSRFLVCRERFRLSVCEGLRTEEGFQHKLEYGNMWHVCEEHYAAGEPWHTIRLLLLGYCRELISRYPTQQEQIDKWYNVCLCQFPVYLEYWKKHKKGTEQAPLLQEEVFDINYVLPNTRVVRLRGKWDSVHLSGKGPNRGIWLQENKTKGDIKEEVIRRQLKFDLQTMLYLVALSNDTGIDALEDVKGWNGHEFKTQIRGVLYNVVRRPLSGGKGTIVQKKGSKNVRPESKTEYYARLRNIIVEDQSSYFMRWEVPITPTDIDNFKTHCLNPLLSQLCEWWDWVSACYKYGSSPFDWADGGYTNWLHWQHPYGVANVLNEGGSSDLDSYLETGNTVGLRKIDNLYPELTVTTPNT